MGISTMDMKKIVTPFVEATVECFSTMMDVEPSLKDIVFEKPPIKSTDTCALIGMSGEAQGVVALTFGEHSAKKSVARFLGEKEEELDDDLTDAVGEIINIIAGAAKAKIEGVRLTISLPTVMQGSNFLISIPKNVPMMSMQFDAGELGEVIVAVAIKDN